MNVFQAISHALAAAAPGAKSCRVTDPAASLSSAKRDVEGGTSAVVEVVTRRAPGSLLPRWTARKA